jgi:hypothetical protein
MPARQSAPRSECGAGGPFSMSRLLRHPAVPGLHRLQSAAPSSRAGAGEPPAERPTGVPAPCSPFFVCAPMDHTGHRWQFGRTGRHEPQAIRMAHVSAAAGPEAGRESFYDEDSGITWVDFTEIIRQASAGGRAAAVAADVEIACARSWRSVRRSRGECSQKPLGRRVHRMRACLSARVPLRISVRPHAHRVVPRRAGQGADAARGLVPTRRQHVGAGDDGPEDGCRRDQCEKRIRHSRRCLPAQLALRLRAAAQVSRTSPGVLTVAVLLGSGPQTSASIEGWWTWTRMYRRL